MQVEMEMHFRTPSHTRSQEQNPNPACSPHWVRDLHLPPDRTLLSARRLHLRTWAPSPTLLCSYCLRETDPYLCSTFLLPLVSFWYFPQPLLLLSLFSSFFEKLLERGVSIHQLLFLTSHSILNHQQSESASGFPLPVTISVDLRKILMGRRV